MKTNKQKTLLARIGIIGLLAAGVMLLAACQAATQPAAQSAQAQGFGANGQRPDFQMTPAPELPSTAPTARGILTKIDGSTLTVLEPGFLFGQGNGGTPRPRPTPALVQTVQVVVNSSTQYYQDVTMANPNGQPPSGAIQQKVEKGSLSALTDDEGITVWGDQTGDQITARVIVFSQFRGGSQTPQPPQG